ncbi:MAG: PAS domain-containing protein [Thermoplasmatota archaeon]
MVGRFASLVAVAAVLALSIPSVAAGGARSQEQQVQAAWQGFVSLAHGFGVAFAGDKPVQNVTSPRETFDLYPLGDSDGDGADDVLAIYRPIGNVPAGGVTGRTQALSGRDLQRVLWSHDLVGAYESPAGDVDGDGVQDLAYSKSGALKVSSAPVSLVVASGGEFTYEVPIRQELRSGIDGNAIVGRDGKVMYDDTGASGGFLLYASAHRTQMSIDSLLAMGNGTYTALQTGIARDFDYASAVVAFAEVYGGASTLTLQSLDGAGNPTGSAGTTGTFDNLILASTGHLDAKPGADLCVVVSEDAAPDTVYAEGVPLVLEGQASPVRVEAWSSADAAKIWSRTFDRQVAYERLAVALTIGDVDGDGRDDIEYVDAQLPTPASVQEHIEILSGKDAPPRVASARSEPALERRASHLDLVQEWLGLGSWEIDVASKRFWWSDGLARLLGFSPDECPANGEAAAGLVVAADRERFLAVARQAFDKGTSEATFRVRCADGTEIAVQCLVKAQRDRDGVPKSVSGVVVPVPSEARPGRNEQPTAETQ